MWYVFKIKNGITFSNTKPETGDYIVLSNHTQDRFIYGFSHDSFDEAMEMAKRKPKEALVIGYRCGDEEYLEEGAE
jgi:hypothetical protein